MKHLMLKCVKPKLSQRYLCEARVHNKPIIKNDKVSFKKLENKYSAILTEDPSVRYWDSKNRFEYNLTENVYKLESDKIFSLALPPPNITGSLHLGHALTATLQDVICRFMRLNGSKVCWLPGTDHAGIATQVVVEKYLSKQNLTRYDLGYEKFIAEIHKWKAKNEESIQNQLKTLGASLDWSKEVFTMDPNQTKAVKEAFIRLFDEGLIYRSNNLVNWSCYLNSSISDIEVSNIEVAKSTLISVPGYKQPVKFGLLYNIAYKIVDSSEEIVIATTRPETLLGDVAIAVNSNDVRYSHLIGKFVKHPFINKTLPIISDDSVDINFGTGALKITPAHDKNDFSVAKKHNLISVSVINEKGYIEEGFESFSGMKRYDAREKILNDLKNLNLLRCINDHKMFIPICSRSGDVIEILLRPQWYISCKEMYLDSINSIENGNLTLIPNDYKRILLEWLDVNKDWCISRQLWWGHQIPAYKCYSSNDTEKFIWIAAHDEEHAKIKSSKILNQCASTIYCKQDEDVLDTWFSSALYPFSSHGWPNSTKQYKELYPLNLMITGHDITFFWVCRMVMLGTKLTGKLPFSKVLLHGIICDGEGAKMSKSKGNVIEPQDIINGISLEELNNKTKLSHSKGLLTDSELKNTLKKQKEQFVNGIPRCGADALRFTLCSADVKNTYINFEIAKCYSNAVFCNKIWQSVRFTQNITESVNIDALNLCNTTNLNYMDLWLLSKLDNLVRSVYKSLYNYNFHLATTALKKFLYAELCDVYIECIKMDARPIFNDLKMATHCHTLSASFNTALRLLSPFMPFISEKLIDHIPLEFNCIINYDDTLSDLSIPNENIFSQWENKKIEDDINVVLKVVSAIRHLKTAYNIKKQEKPLVYIQNIISENKEIVQNYTDLILYLSSSEKLMLVEKNEAIDINMSTYTIDNSAKVCISYVGSNGVNVTTPKSSKNLEKMRKTLIKLESMVSSEGFKKAPEKIQISTRNKILALRDQLKNI